MRPLTLPGPRNGVPDNLQRIRGIGQKNEELLNSLGIFHFGQLAAWTPAEARWVANHLAFPERIERDDWVGQAIILATGGDTGYVKVAERRKGRGRRAAGHCGRIIADGKSGRIRRPSAVRRDRSAATVARDDRFRRRPLAFDADDEGRDALKDRRCRIRSGAWPSPATVIAVEAGVLLLHPRHGLGREEVGVLATDGRTGKAPSAPNSFHKDGIGRSNSTPSKVFASAGS